MSQFDDKPPSAGDQRRAAPAALESHVNVPNALSCVRFVGSFLMVGAAVAGGSGWLLPIFALLLLTDWIDGKLAILLGQRTVFGARLDSLADATFYLATLVALWWLKSDLVLAAAGWIAAALAAYGVSCLAGLIKFGRVPTYHTRGAKTAWLLVSLAILAVFARQWNWPLQVAAIWVLLVNIEAILITLVLPRAEVDVASLYHALALRRRWWLER